uniref:Phosphatidylglycerophosphatase and protein-tyrosine phosphatase 1 n=1 Tax=Oryctolagus cuniculus TaxID=9986 RepID=G1TF40_RABIT
ALSWPGRGATGTESSAPTGTRTRCAGAARRRISLVSRSAGPLCCLLRAPLHPAYIWFSLHSFFMCCTWFQEWKKFGVEQLRLSTVDMTGIPTLANLKKGVQFALKYQALGQCVYVHCKAGRSRSATMVAAYLIQVHKWSPEEAVRAITKIRSHIHIRPGQLQVLKEFHKITSEAAKNETVIHQ